MPRGARLKRSMLRDDGNNEQETKLPCELNAGEGVRSR